METPPASREARRRLPLWALAGLGGLAVGLVVFTPLGILLGAKLEGSSRPQPRIVTITSIGPDGEVPVDAWWGYKTAAGESGRFVQPPELEPIPGHSNEARFVEQAPDDASLVTTSIGYDFVPGTQHGNQGEWSHNDPLEESPGGLKKWVRLSNGDYSIVIQCRDEPNTSGRAGTGTRNGSCSVEQLQSSALTTSGVILHLPQAGDAILNRRMGAEEPGQAVTA